MAEIKRKKSIIKREYYNMQEVMDDLYSKSKKNYKFRNLMQFILDDKNILLAYRTIKFNKGSKTSGTNTTTIKDIQNWTSEQVIEYVKQRLSNYRPHEVKRKYIPKSNGKTRPLGIPTMEDRLIQQCIKQVLEPICEAKFHPHSYGFRPNRTTEHAISRCVHSINITNMYYVVDVDIKSFFDNVNHGKLLKQMWSFGIRDKTLLSILSKILKAPIKGEGIPTKGTPQGGVISPLLSNIVLNELDWWISNQWETFKSRTPYKYVFSKHRALRKSSKLKPCFIVRYADDFKIFCKSYNHARKLFHAVKQWLKDRLGLDISEEKSKIVNLRKQSSEFLGFKLKAIAKDKTYKAYTYMSDKSIKNCTNKIKQAIKDWQKCPKPQQVSKLNAIILGEHNYYKIATLVSHGFSKIAFDCQKTLYNRTKSLCNSSNKIELVMTKAWDTIYSKYKNSKPLYLNSIRVYPIHGRSFQAPMNFKQSICEYTEEGRQLIYEKFQYIDYKVMNYMARNYIPNRSVEYNDNRISLYSAQKGKCSVTGLRLTIGNIHCHHINNIKNGGDDSFKNLTLVTTEVHRLIHANTDESIHNCLSKIPTMNTSQLTKLNKLRKKSGTTKIPQIKYIKNGVETIVVSK